MIPNSIGRYELRSVLARTAGSTVYEGWDSRLTRRVAIKTVLISDKSDPETQQILFRFARGAQAAGVLTHPCIVSLYDYGETDDSAYMVMEYVDGVTLKALLDRTGPMPLVAIVPIIEDVLAGLAYSHAQGIVHRDIKPANLMILSNGRAKIADFGAARIENSDMTQVGTVIGTPAYMSPEQVRGESVDQRTDIYSVGVVLYQMLTGKRPHEGGVATIAHKVLNVEPPAPSQVRVGFSSDFDAIVRCAMAKDRTQRYRSAQEFARAVREAGDIDTSDHTIAVPPRRRAAEPAAVPAARTAAPPAAASRARMEISARKRGIGAAGVAVAVAAVLAGAVGAVLLWPSKPTPTRLAAAAEPARPQPAALPITPPPITPAQVAAPPETPPITPQITPSITPPAPALLDLSTPAQLAPFTPPAVTPAAVVLPTQIAPSPPPAKAAAAPLVHEMPALLSAPAAVTPMALAAADPAAAMTVRKRTPPPPPTPARPQPARTPPADTPAPVAPGLSAATTPAPRPPPSADIKPAAASARARVHLFYPGNSANGLQQTTDLARRLLFSEFEYVGTRSSASPPTVSEVRYFHPEDQDAAQRLAALLDDAGVEFQVRDGSDRPATPPRGALEVWIGR